MYCIIINKNVLYYININVLYYINKNVFYYKYAFLRQFVGTKNRKKGKKKKTREAMIP